MFASRYTSLADTHVYTGGSQVGALLRDAFESIIYAILYPPISRALLLYLIVYIYISALTRSSSTTITLSPHFCLILYHPKNSLFIT